MDHEPLRDAVYDPTLHYFDYPDMPKVKRPWKAQAFAWCSIAAVMVFLAWSVGK